MINQIPITQECPALSRSRGCLIGGAVGDALGAAIEFMDLQTIKERFGAQGITEYAPCYGRDGGAITDDTQMTIFTAEGLLRAHVRKLSKGISSIPSVTCHSYLRWLLTQGYQPKVKNVSTDGWLYHIQSLHSECSPGTTCIDALMEMEEFTSRKAKNDSKGCGGVMRVAPVGIFGHSFLKSPNADNIIFELGCNLAGLTHGHPTGYLSGGTFALIIAYLVSGMTIPEAVERALGIVAAKDNSSETVGAITLALKLAEKTSNQSTAIQRIGEGWVAEEALAIGIYAALSATDFSSGIRFAVNHGGDSDSTGSIAGNLLGAALGINAIDPKWLQKLELQEPLDQLAHDLIDYQYWGENDEALWSRYPGH